ncbi:PfkB family carbohydrate kinase [Paracoccus aeridis]|uniref:PfkB family carbohydrate kinase n=1 Tax=Paracoccus aeridis TaxID=1966466 RepID=UPI0010A9BB9A|nr:PfkB family carbohydrate kinase [Paracoccus aeridis]
MAIFNLGSINVDYVYRLAALAEPGETVAARSLSRGLGGKGANQSIAAARAGAAVCHIGAIAESDAWVAEILGASAVDVAGVARLADAATGHAIIMVDEHGENAIVIHPGANRALAEGDVLQALSGIGPADTLLLQNETSHQRAAAAFARRAGARVIYSAAPFDLDAVREVLPFVSILAVNAGEAARLQAGIDAPLPVAGMLVTMGADGAEYRDLASGRVTRQAAFPVTPVDTTGAGDCFAGWFAAGLDAGLGIDTALRRAAAAAALQVTRPGAADAMPALDEVIAFLDKAGP